MFKMIYTRVRQGHRTIKYPSGPPPEMPERFRGLPDIKHEKCSEGCSACIDSCPAGALLRKDGIVIDLGKCIFCTDCTDACRENAVSFTKDYRLSAGSRNDLVLSCGNSALNHAAVYKAEIKKIFGRSLKLRQVSAGGCNACEADVNVLNTIGWDIGRFGIQFVASPRHADGLLITGPITKNMELALKKTYDAVPDPRIVIAAGACAISGGIYDGEETFSGAESIVPVDLYIPGCPPHPLTILDGILRMLGRI